VKQQTIENKEAMETLFNICDGMKQTMESINVQEQQINMYIAQLTKLVMEWLPPVAKLPPTAASCVTDLIAPSTIAKTMVADNANTETNTETTVSNTVPAFMDTDRNTKCTREGRSQLNLLTTPECTRLVLNLTTRGIEYG